MARPATAMQGTPDMPAAHLRSNLRCDIDLMAQGKAHGFVRLPHSIHRSAYGWIPIPIVRIANGPGPSVLLVAGNHGDEWEGQIALYRQWMARTLELINAFGAPVANIVASPPSGGRSFTAASLRQGVLSIATEIGGGGQVSMASLAAMEAGIRSVLSHVGMLNDAVPSPAGPPTRLTAVGGDTHHVYATEPGLFEPLASIGQQVQTGQPAARIHRHDSPWREPELLRFQADALILCQRVPTLCARGDYLYQLASDTTIAD